jgi:hypothetical protein
MPAINVSQNMPTASPEPPPPAAPAAPAAPATTPAPPERDFSRMRDFSIFVHGNLF